MRRANPATTLAQVLSGGFMSCTAFHSSAALQRIQATGRSGGYNECVSMQAALAQQAHAVRPAKCCQQQEWVAGTAAKGGLTRAGAGRIRESPGQAGGICEQGRGLPAGDQDPGEQHTQNLQVSHFAEALSCRRIVFRPWNGSQWLFTTHAWTHTCEAWQTGSPGACSQALGVQSLLAALRATILNIAA